jgi:hypothetical protein
MEQRTYYIYHIPDYVHNDGVIGKIGCTDNLERRAGQYKNKYSLEELESHTCIYKASDREKELQKEYGYKVDRVLYYINYFKRQSPDDRFKRSESMSGDKNHNWGKTGDSSFHFGRQRSEETKQKIRDKATGRAHDSQTKRKIADKLKGRPFEQYTKEGVLIKEWYSTMDVQRSLSIHNGGVSSCLNGRGKSYKGFIWKYKN